MIRRHPATAGSLLAEVRTYFGLSQAELSYLLGVVQPRIAQAETGLRHLPAAAVPRLRALQAAMLAPPTPLPAPDWQPVHRRLAQVQAQADALHLQLTHYLPPRRAAAEARLGAALALPATLATAEAEEPLPPRRREDQQATLTQLHHAARAEWDARSGPTPTALLRARLAALRAEAQALAQELAPGSC